MARSSTTQTTNIPLDQIQAELDRGVSGADTLRAADLAGLGRMREAKAASQERRAARLARRYGESDPRVQVLTEKAAVNRAYSRQLAFERDRTQGGAPNADPDAWILHGHVRNADLSAAPGLTVAVYDDKGNWIQAFGHDCTDAGGRFKLLVQPPSSGGQGGDPVLVPIGSRPLDQQGSGQDTAGRPSKAGATARAVEIDIPDLFVTLFDKSGQQIHQDDDKLVPQLGEVDYREIILGDTICPPPPGGSGPTPPTDGKPGDKPGGGKTLRPDDEKPREKQPGKERPRGDKPGTKPPKKKPPRKQPPEDSLPLKPKEPSRDRPTRQPVRRIDRQPKEPSRRSPGGKASAPGKSQPAKTQPAKAQPAKVEPAKAKAQPARKAPAQGKVAKAKTTRSKPVQSKPARKAPAKKAPGRAKPAKAAPAKATGSDKGTAGPKRPASGRAKARRKTTTTRRTTRTR